MGTVRLKVLRWGVAALAAALLAVGSGLPASAAGGDDGPRISAPHAILIAENGSVLYERDADVLIPPASLAKLMTAEYVFHQLKTGKIKLTDQYEVSEYAWRHGGAPSHTSTMFAKLHSMVSVDDLLHGMIIQSANDACIVFAEALGGNEGEFGHLLTARAREIGLKKSTFANSNGLPDPGEKVTTRELATLARHIIQTYPDFYKIFGQPEFTWNKIRQYNRNPLLKMSIGADGLKTGFTKEAGYGLVGSAVQGGLRLIVVVNGDKTAKQRADDGKKLLDWGFHHFESRLLFAEGQTIGSAKVFGGADGYVPLKAKRAGARHGAQERRRPAVRAHRLYRAGAGAGRGRPAGRQSAGVARRQGGPDHAAAHGRQRQGRHVVAARLRRRH